MLRILTLSNFKIAFQEYEANRDDIVRISYIPNLKNPAEEKFGYQYGLILAPHMLGVVDRTINDTDYHCHILFDDETPNLPNNPYPYFAWFTRIHKNVVVETDPKEPGKVGQTQGDRVSPLALRGLRGPTGNTAINLGEDAVEIIAGDFRVVIGQGGIMEYGQKMTYDLPTATNGGIFQQTGIMHLIPDVPPFGQIKIMPGGPMIMKAVGTLTQIRMASALLKTLAGG